MRRKIFFAVVLLGSFFVFNNVFSANTDIIINEIGAFPTSTHEWVEIWNKGTDMVDLTGWKFWENNTNHGLAVSSTDNLMAPGEYAAICQDETQFLLDHPIFTGSVFDSTWGSLTEDGEEIGLKDAGGNFIEKFSYPSFSNQHSLERKNPNPADYTVSNWQEHATGDSLGGQNSNYSVATEPTPTSTPTSTPPTVSWSGLRLNEAVPNPESGNEWVEIFNAAATNIDLAGGYICDNRGTTSTCKDAAGTVAGGGWLFLDLMTDSFLNNDGDSVILKNPDGSVIDQIVYSGETIPDKGQALARSTDGGGDWAITTALTPGGANSILAPAVASSGGVSGGAGAASSETASTSSKTTVKESSKSKTTTEAKKEPEEKVVMAWKAKVSSQGQPYKNLVFDAGGSADPRGGQVRYQWNFGDGSIVPGAVVSHSYNVSGVFVVTLSATSTAGTIGQTKFSVRIGSGLATVDSGVVINEICPNPAGADDNEFVELYNTNSVAINISRWYLVYENKEYVMPTSTIIMPHSHLVFYRAVTHFALDNSGGVVELQSPDKAIVSTVKYDKSASGKSYDLLGGLWQWVETPTPGSLNYCEASSGTLEKVAKPAKSAKSATTKKAVYLKTGDIAAARALPKNSGVTVKGVVTVLPGVLGSQFFYIGDADIGIQVYQYKKLFPPLALGDLVQIKGVISESGAIKRIKVSKKEDINILSIGNSLPERELALQEIDEGTLGGLVRLKGEITEIKTNYFYLDDGTDEQIIYLKRGAKIDKKKFQEGENVEVAGIVEQAKTGFQLWPRGQSDLVSLGPSDDLLKKQGLSAAPKASDTAEKYLTATAGGLTTLLLGFLARARGAVVKSATKRIILAIAGLIKKDKV